MKAKSYVEQNASKKEASDDLSQADKGKLHNIRLEAILFL